MAFLAPKPIASLIFLAHDEYGRDKARADDFLIKPLKSKELLQVIERASPLRALTTVATMLVPGLRWWKD